MNELKKPMNAYFLYKEATRAVLSKNIPTPSSSDISKMAAANWKLEPEHVKEEYRVKARAAFGQYKVNKKSMIKTSTTIPVERTRRRAKTTHSDSSQKVITENNDLIDVSDNTIRKRINSLTSEYKDFDTFVDAFMREFHTSRKKTTTPEIIRQ
ncbi:hypothetical protein HDV04_005403 [Boothiomyces sp. JEL0838]|nr:hypothetical protein HDV04_005403 [Boothiomyces sp. JEL0838]